MVMSAVHRKGDQTTGHSGWVVNVSDAGSPTVFANNIPVVRTGDHFATHPLPVAPPHDAVGAQGSPTVFVENQAVMRIGDETSCSDKIASGSPDCYCN